MSKFPGPVSTRQLNDLSKLWDQGEHILISGSTGSGKTALARYVADQRAKLRGGTHMVMVGKLKPDKTITDEYKGYTRWTKWKKNPSVYDKRVLLWPDTDKYKTVIGKREYQKEFFREALDKLSNIGKWTVQCDEGLYFCDPKFLNLADHWAMLHAMGRSSKLTLLTLTQRPAHIPLIIYGSATHAFVSQTREETDRKRLAELGGPLGSRDLMKRIGNLANHEFMWISPRNSSENEIVNLAK